MPEKMEKELRKEVEKKHPNWSKEKKDAYIYGTMRKTGWSPSTQKKSK
jgi:hypothetical protein